MKPSCNGAPAGAITIGIVRVAPIAARIAGVKWATMIRRWSGRRSAGIREKDFGPAARALRRGGHVADYLQDRGIAFEAFAPSC
jgi:hypothetical protein